MSPAAVKRLICEPDAPTAALQFILIPCFCSGCGLRLCFIYKFYDSTITVQEGAVSNHPSLAEMMCCLILCFFLMSCAFCL